MLYSISLFGFITYFVPNTYFKVFGLSLLTSLDSISSNTFTSILAETMNSNSKLRSRGVTLFFMFYGVGGPILGGLGFLVQNPDTLYLIYLCAIVVAAFPFAFIILEPVKKLYNQNKISSVFRTLNKISKINKKQVSLNELQDYVDIKNVDLANCDYEIITKATFSEKLREASSSFRILFSKKYFSKLFGFYVINLTGYFLFNAVTFNAGNIGLPNIQINVIFLSTLQGAMYVVVAMFISNIKRKTTLFILQLTYMGTAVLLYLIHNVFPKFEQSKLVET